MGKFKAGDRVKILAGHPYTFAPEAGGTVLSDEGKLQGRRAKYVVALEGYIELTFKGRELELLPPVVAEATTWVPKVGDRVRVKNPHCLRDGTPVGAEGVVIRTYVGNDHFDIDLTHPDDGVIEQYVNQDNVEPLPVVAPATTAPLTIEAGKFYRTRDGRKVGPLRVYDHGYFHLTDVAGPDSTLLWAADGRGIFNTDLVAEWVDEPIAAADEPAVAPATAGFKVGDRVNWTRHRHCWQDVEITKVDTSSMYPVIARDQELGDGAFPIDELEFVASAPATPLPLPGTTITFTATGKVSAINDNGHVQVTFPDLPPGKNSFALPARYVAAA